MLTRVENSSITFVPHFLSKRGHVRVDVGKKWYEWKNWRLTYEEFDQFLTEREDIPFRFDLEEKTYWLFEDRFYKDSEELTADEVKALLLTRKKQQRSRIERAKTISASSTAIQNFSSTRLRTAIPDDTKLLVWQRDQGRCAKCGSNVELQFDHIIPVSLGGASTPENLQILCGTCNRAKSNSII
jgi:5-methylcytosine-specific restriction endonuclease McrA